MQSMGGVGPYSEKPMTADLNDDGILEKGEWGVYHDSSKFSLYDADKDSVLSKKEYAFALADKDGDGLLNTDKEKQDNNTNSKNFNRRTPETGRMGRGSSTDVLASTDLDKSGSIERGEWNIYYDSAKFDTADTDKSGVLSKQEYSKAISDKDGDGILSEKETSNYNSIMKSFGRSQSPSGGRVNDGPIQGDFNKDGKLSQNEWNVYHDDKAVSGQSTKYTILDEDKDGVLSKEEYTKSLADKDQDGKLSEQETKDYNQKLKSFNRFYGNRH